MVASFNTTNSQRAVDNKAAGDSTAIIDNITPYANAWEHLLDELNRLYWLIHLQVLKQQNRQSANPLDQFKGLVLSEEEISRILVDVDLQLVNERPSAIDRPSANDCPLPRVNRFNGHGLNGDSLSSNGLNGNGAHGYSAENPNYQNLLAALDNLESQIKKRRAASLREKIFLPLPHLSQLFQLTPFEEFCLIICLAPELDRRYEKLYAYLQDDMTSKKPSVDLMLNLLCRTGREMVAAREAFDPRSPLLKYRLVQMIGSSPDGPLSLLSRYLKIDDRIINFLLDFKEIDARLMPIARLVYAKTGWDQVMVAEEVQSRVQGFVRSFFSEAEMDKEGLIGQELGRQGLVFSFYGPYGAGKRLVTEAVCRDLGLPLIMADLRKMLTAGSAHFEEIAWLLGREAALQPAALGLQNFDCLLSDHDQHQSDQYQSDQYQPDHYQSQLELLFEVIRTFSPLTFLLGNRSWNPQGGLKNQLFISLEFPVPDDKARKELWENHLSSHMRGNRLASDIDFGALAGKFRFTPGQIQDAMAAAQKLACWRSPADGLITMSDLYAACRAQSNHRLSALACQVRPTYTWNDIMLPKDQMKQLKGICSQAKYRHLVYGEWGFGRKLSLGKGLNVLFSGPPGTGKTMAAEIMASELHLDLYKIDLSQVVSKYIGETEKNLHRIFCEAQASSAILFFDEADALFGKRSEIKDAHDRYANIEIGYLLQKMEEFEGICILATNLRNNMDEAFVRRLQTIVEFPFPDERQRELIWKGIFPKAAPLSSDIDYEFLSRKLRLSGGNIKNIVLMAAFYAAEESSEIGMPQIMQAVRREYQKMGKPFLKPDLEPYYQLTEGK